jgi:hypothetical protein
MDGMAFDTVTRQSFGSALRSGSIFSLGAAGLRAAVASSGTVDAKHKGGKKKKKHQNQNQQAPQPAPQECPPLAADLCPGEVQPCVDALTVACGAADPADCAPVLACCSHFETCAFGEFFTCLFAAANT